MHATGEKWGDTVVDVHLHQAARSFMKMAFITFNDANACKRCYDMVWRNWWAEVAIGSLLLSLRIVYE